MIYTPQKNQLEILWKDGIGTQIKIYKFNTVTYDTSNARYFGARSFKQLTIGKQNNLTLA